MCEKELVEHANFGRRPLVLQPQKNYAAMAQAVTKDALAKVLVIGDDNARLGNSLCQDVYVAHRRCPVVHGEYVMSERFQMASDGRSGACVYNEPHWKPHHQLGAMGYRIASKQQAGLNIMHRQAG